MKRIPIPWPFLTGALFLLLGCSGVLDRVRPSEDPPVVEDDPTPSTTSGTAPPVQATALPPSFATAAYRCCSVEKAQAVVNAYLELHDALSDDNLGRSRRELASLRKAALAGSKHASITLEGRTLCSETARLLEPVKSGSLSQIRGVMGSVSQRVIELSRMYQGGTHQIAVAIEPTNDLRWIQSEPVIRNPYFGKKQLSSGNFTQ